MHSGLLDRLEVVEGDITAETTDAIVNAANESLLGGGGVDGAIHRAAGPNLLEACRMLHGCPTGQAKVTGGFDLPARWVIHAVGPVFDEDDADTCDKDLGAAYLSALLAAAEVGAHSLSYPAISTGAYGFPADRAARVAVLSVAQGLTAEPRIQKVRFVCFDDRTARLHEAAIEALRTLASA